MKVLVTGANGFLGSWLTKKLVHLGHDVHILHRPNSDLSDLQGLAVTSAIGDVTDLASVDSATRGCEVVFHLAGVVAYKASQRAMMQKVNVGGTENMITACLTNCVKRLVHLSSVVAVGASFDGKILLTEESPFNLTHLDLGYFETKRKAEELVKGAVHTKGLDAVLLNPCTIYGPGDAKKGSRNVQVKVAKGKFPFYTSGGVSVVSVHDVVDGIISGWLHGKTGERYILSGENITIQTLFTWIAEEAGVPAPRWQLPSMVLHALGKIGDRMERFGIKGPISSENAWTSTLFHWFDNAKARRELGFAPGSARRAIAESVRWMKENKRI